MNTLIIFHAACCDGFGSYWAAHRKFGKNAKYWAAYHGDEPPDVHGKDVYLLDFCYSREVMEEMASEAKSITVIDHHISAKNNMEGFKKGTLIFDMEHSGAVLSWMFFHPGKPVPLLLTYIEDRDLWNWKVEDSDLFLSGLDSHPMTLAVYDAAALKPQNFIKEGAPIQRFRKILVESAMESAQIVSYKGHKFIAVNEGRKEIVSELGNRLVEKHGLPAFVWSYDHSDNQTKVSLRSSDKIDINVSEIARKFSGGGHRNASGFSLFGLINFD